MKAVIFEKGNPEGPLVLREIANPAPQEGEVRVKIIATAVNAGDYRSMQMGSIPKNRIFGSDIAGEVAAVDQNASRLKIGDKVAGDISACGLGGFAEFVAVPETALSLIPDGVSFEEAAAASMAAVTALQGLRMGRIAPGQKVLIYGAGGGVGSFAVQLAKHFGTQVTAVCSPYNVDLAGSLGADCVIDYTRENFKQRGELYDLILVANGNEPLSAFKRLLTPGGLTILSGGAFFQFISAMFFSKKKIQVLAAKPAVKDSDFILSLVKDGKIKAVIDRRYPLEKTAEAVAYLRQGHVRGKVIITIANPQQAIELN